jgi:pyruvate ferredoxin oxidoreductase delta subunit
MNADKEKNKKAGIPLAGAVNKSTKDNKTGAWRTFRPIITEKCTGCGTCIMFCPDNCIFLVDRKDKSKLKKIVKVNYDYCKGCLICANECPLKAIEKEREK